MLVLILSDGIQKSHLKNAEWRILMRSQHVFSMLILDISDTIHEILMELYDFVLRMILYLQIRIFVLSESG